VQRNLIPQLQKPVSSAHFIAGEQDYLALKPQLNLAQPSQIPGYSLNNLSLNGPFIPLDKQKALADLLRKRINT